MSIADRELTPGSYYIAPDPSGEPTLWRVTEGDPINLGCRCDFALPAWWLIRTHPSVIEMTDAAFEDDDLDAFHCRLCDGLLIDNGNGFEAEGARHQDGACFGAVVA